ncbi:UNVERIFIED_CONTAM: hypothetical protein Slati_2525600 [Sesamum latifolium]|uniref:Reverse transcriptase Ty1/copia-type domain-containing protein n=1 Tax=Sesamum latifolium TaxID=2727402 RepID=A0AAW2WKW0_9LAMI
MFCDCCGKSVHSKDTCFKIHGVPDWYKDLIDQRKKIGGRGRGRGFATVIADEKVSVQSEGVTNIADIIRTKRKKFMHDEDQRTKKVVEVGKLVGNLYVLESSSSIVVQENKSVSMNSNCNLNSCAAAMCNVDIWHRRLGHLSKNSMKHTTSLPQTDSTNTPCDVCPLAKMHKLPFTFSAIRTKSAFDLVYINLDISHEIQKPKFGNFSKFIQPPTPTSPLPTIRLTADINDFVSSPPPSDDPATEPSPPSSSADIVRNTNSALPILGLQIKLKGDGLVECYKARLVAKGYTQVEGLDYTKRFSPIVKSITVRLFLTIATVFKWPIDQIDINNASLHGHLDEEIYTTAPEDYDVAPGHTDSGFTGLVVYVDDVRIMAPMEDLISQVKAYLDDLFTIKDLGCARYFLGLQIALSDLGTSLSHTKHTMDIITNCGLLQAESAATPLSHGLKLHSSTYARLDNPEPYRCLVGCLLYLSFTCPDISHGVQQLSQFLQHPCHAYWHAALHMVWYLKGTFAKGIFFRSSNSL